MKHRKFWALVLLTFVAISQSGCRGGAGSTAYRLLDAPPPQMAGSEGTKGWYESEVHGSTD